MLYLSLILVATGLYLVVSSIFSRQGARSGIHFGDRYIPNDDFQAGLNAYPATGRRERSGDTDGSGAARTGVVRASASDESAETVALEDFRGEDEAPADDISAGKQGILDELDASFNDTISSDVPEPGDGPRESRSPGNAVLYEDASGLVDYEGGESTIDPSLEAYRDLRRVGSGGVEIASEGLIVRIGKAVHRFDFYKVRDYRIGDNYIALYLKGSRAVRLFLMDDNPDLRFEIQAAVEDYFRAAS
jgi:hypothetical protein